MRATACLRTIAALTALLLVTGCGTTRPNVPNGWRPAAEATGEINGWDTTSGQVIQRPPSQGVLQVMVAYGPVHQTHAALRLEAGKERIVHWDPGGDFGRRDPGFNRLNDVMSGTSSSLQRIWHFRRSACGNDAMLVFEFDLPIAHVAKLQDALVYSAKNPTDPLAFKTLTTPSQCTRNLCKFLRQRSPNQPFVPQVWIFPHELGSHLWSQDPDRVIVFRKTERPQVLVPSTRTRTTAAAR